MLLVLALLFGLSYPDGLLFSIPVATLNIIIGLFVKTHRGVEVQKEPSKIKLIIDRGVSRASIYQLVFTDTKLVLKRLSSVNVTVVLALVSAILGLYLLGIVGALMGGITGFSLQEFLTQRARNRIDTETKLLSTGRSDIEIQYDDLSEVRLAKSKVYLNAPGKNTVVVAFPRGYSTLIAPTLAKILGSQFTADESVRTAETT